MGREVLTHMAHEEADVVVGGGWAMGPLHPTEFVNLLGYWSTVAVAFIAMVAAMLVDERWGSSDGGALQGVRSDGAGVREVRAHLWCGWCRRMGAGTGHEGGGR